MTKILMAMASLALLAIGTGCDGESGKKNNSGIDFQNDELTQEINKRNWKFGRASIDLFTDLSAQPDAKISTEGNTLSVSYTLESGCSVDKKLAVKSGMVPEAPIPNMIERLLKGQDTTVCSAECNQAECKSSSNEERTYNMMFKFNGDDAGNATLVFYYDWDGEDHLSIGLTGTSK